MTKRSFQQTQSLVERALTAQEKPQTEGYPGYLWIRSLWDDTVVYQGFDEKTYRRSFSIDANEIVTFGDREEVREVVDYEAVPMPAFAVNFSSQQPDYVEWSGDVFEAGTYTDKNCSFSPEDLKAIAETNTGRLIPLKIEHQDTPLDAVLKGFGMSEITATDDGKLSAKVRVPKWLDDGLGNTERKVSLGFGSDLKTLREISLVRNPRVASAQLFARDIARTFSAANPQALNLSDDEVKALNDLAQAKTPAPAPARASQETKSMNFAQKIEALWDAASPDKRDSLGFTKAELLDPANFSQEKPAPDPRDTALARMAAQRALDALKLEGYGGNDAAFTNSYIRAVKQDGGGAVTFSQDTGDVVTGAAVKDVIELAKSARKVHLGGNRVPIEFSAGKDDGLSEYDKGLGLKAAKN